MAPLRSRLIDESAVRDGVPETASGATLAPHSEDLKITSVTLRGVESAFDGDGRRSDRASSFAFVLILTETQVTLTTLKPLVILLTMPRKVDKLNQRNRAPRIRVPNQERAIFVVEEQKFVGIVQRLSLTGGSALLVKGPIPEGTLGAMALTTVFGKVKAHIEFLHTGADGVPLAQAFRFLAMDPESAKRFNNAAEQMQSAGFADVEPKTLDGALESWRKLRDSVRQLSGMLTSGRRRSR